MVYTTGADAVWMQNTAPLWVFLLSALWLRGPEASGIALLDPLLLPVWVFLAWGSEVPIWWTLFGGALILAGLVQRYVAIVAFRDPRL